MSEEILLQKETKNNVARQIHRQKVFCLILQYSLQEFPLLLILQWSVVVEMSSKVNRPTGMVSSAFPETHLALLH